MLRDFSAYLNTTNVHRIATAVFIVLLGIGLGLGFGVSSSNARSDSDADYNRRLAIFSQWQMDLTSHFTKAGSLSATLGAFVLASVTTPANMSAPSLQRMVRVNDEGFQRLCQQIYIPGITVMVLAPGGIITQMYPPGFAPPGLDMYNSNTYKHLYPGFFNNTGLSITGPDKLAAIAGHGAHVWFPVHVSNKTTIESFWGMAYVMIKISTLLESLNVSQVMDSQGMDYAMWYTFTNASGSFQTVVAESEPAVTGQVMSEGMRMRLPIAEPGRSSYLAMHPKAGPVSSTVGTRTTVAIVVATVAGAASVILFGYLLAYGHFLYRHRNAPASHAPMFAAAIALRGAQPIADRAPYEAMRIFNDFTVLARRLAGSSGCYPVCEVGDRCVFVVSKDPEHLLNLAQRAVLTLTAKGKLPNITDIHSHQNDNVNSPSSMPSLTQTPSYARTKTIITNISEEISHSSFIGTATCRPSVACHAFTSARVYDPARDTYFFGSTPQLSKLCRSVDLARAGEVCWTDDLEQLCPEAGGAATKAALSTYTVSENGETVLHVASLLKRDEDEGDSEDASTAMAVLTDAYIKRMSVLVSEGRAEAKQRRRKQIGADTSSGSSGKSTEATALLRSSTLLHIAVLSGDEKSALEAIRRIVSDERGAVVSAYESTILAAFNLLSAGGNHQSRAADTVLRLREALPRTHFVCSIQPGKVGALVMDGVVMCTGEAVAQGRALLKAAVALSLTTSVPPSSGAEPSTVLDAKLHTAERRKKLRDEAALVGSGLCLMFCYGELGTAYDCEAVDATSLGGSKPRVVYRLAHRRSGKASDDEWMYRLKDEEEQSPFAVVNTIFARIAAHDLDDAARLYREHRVGEDTFEASLFAKASLARHLETSKVKL